MAEPTDRDILIEVKTKVSALHEDLLGAPGREGRIPQLEKTQEKHAEQINLWRGMLVIIAGLITLLGGTFIVHLFGGH